MNHQLHSYVIGAACKWPHAAAVVERGSSTSYEQLDRMANRAANYLRSQGVQDGDRVALWLEKSAWTLALMQGALRLGAAYVPVDPRNPAARVSKLLESARPRVVVAPRHKLEQLEQREGLLKWAEQDAHLAEDATPQAGEGIAGEHIAYILFTSGSTGIPKGVCVSHLNACAFVDWASETLELTSADRLANHAPLHFDLSVLDLYGAFRSGASVHLMPEVLSFVPRSLTEFVVTHEITILYFVPSILSLMIDEGGLLEGAPLRCVVFAGEPFAIQHLRKMRAAWTKTRLLNFYGPTETNVCLAHEVFELDSARTKPVPIGRPACGDEVWVVRDDGELANVGEQGELFVKGPTVMLGYWGNDLAPNRTHATGDIVERLSDDSYEYVGRRDQMVKVRGQRVELGEVEAALLEFPGVRRCAAFVVGDGASKEIHALIVLDGPMPAPLALRRHLAERLPPAWMIDHVDAIEDLPLTSNGKLDRRALEEHLRRKKP